MTARLPAPGTLFAGRYRIEEVLGHGAIGVVLAALDEKTGVDCAIKLLSSPELGQDRARLVREARALMLITHPHVVRVFDVAEDDEGAPFLVLERLEGEDLGARCPLGAALPAAQVIDYAAQVCEALEAAHARGVIHRDIKPSNLFLARTSEGEVIKVLDFGVSKLRGADGQGSLTRADGPLGSPQFISPEQLANPKAVDARTDLWALGVVMYRLLSGRFPFHGETVMETFALVARGERRALHDVAPDVPPVLEAIVDRCLERDPARRWPSAAALRAALLGGEAVAAEDETVTTLATAPPAPAPASRRSWALFAVGLLATLGAGGLLLSSRGGSAVPMPTPAEPSAPAARDDVLREPPPPPTVSAGPAIEPAEVEAPSPSSPRSGPRPRPRPSHRPAPAPAPPPPTPPASDPDLRGNPYR
ncbi:MAG: serine/threonine-protein kinase [Labilithrix sp.]